MYVIWRKRKRKHYRGFLRRAEVGDVRLTPIIVESRRISGKPRQEHVACLPSIIESRIDEKSAVWFWEDVEEQLSRLVNRIPPDDMGKIREALSKVVPVPDPEWAESFKADAARLRGAFLDSWAAPKWAQEPRRKAQTFHASLSTATVCADCGTALKTVYRTRRRFGGRSWSTGVLCKKCARGNHGFARRGPCETCGRAVFISWAIAATRCFCSTRCGQAYYRITRNPSTNSQ